MTDARCENSHLSTGRKWCKIHKANVIARSSEAMVVARHCNLSLNVGQFRSTI